MIWWKEWRELRTRFLTLAGFLLVTVLVVDVGTPGLDAVSDLAITIVGWAAAMTLVPAILGMDAYVGERDQGTEQFLLSKPLGRTRLLLVKVGFRTLLSGALTGMILVVLLLRIRAETGSLYLGMRPYPTLLIILSVYVALFVVLMTTIAVSVRAPYQSTALIIGGFLGALVAAAPVLLSIEPMTALQAPWGYFWLLMLLLLLTTFLACWGIAVHEPGRSTP
jgi:ABC-type transport system involved in multi-copper enzyme maturation permease subunit